MSLLELPAEIIKIILAAAVDSRQNYIAASHVCKKFRAIIMRLIELAKNYDTKIFAEIRAANYFMFVEVAGIYLANDNWRDYQNIMMWHIAKYGDFSAKIMVENLGFPQVEILTIYTLFEKEVREFFAKDDEILFAGALADYLKCKENDYINLANLIYQKQANVFALFIRAFIAFSDETIMTWFIDRILNDGTYAIIVITIICGYIDKISKFGDQLYHNKINKKIIKSCLAAINKKYSVADILNHEVFNILSYQRAQAILLEIAKE